jgi:hypothetical protein
MNRSAVLSGCIRSQHRPSNGARLCQTPQYIVAGVHQLAQTLALCRISPWLPCWSLIESRCLNRT